MTLASGARLGPYEIVSAVGAGGMGEVYKARDTRLDRIVAIKVLPSDAAVDADRLRRFEQEARATAALNHPNILAVFDVGADASVNYVVSELLDGETLRDRLKVGPLPARKAIEHAAQIARGLAAAHDKGIIHRDLKPENLFVTRDGRLKILDFGIAKLVAPRGAHTVAPTVERGTTPGMVLGTAGYMSPEQVRGLDTDHRTDVFSFGAILYEMLSGRRAFAGATEADTMTAILTADPPDTEALRNAPPLVDRLVRRCLEKSPDERFQSARDLAFDLETLSTASHPSGAAVALEAPAPRRRYSKAWLAAGVGLSIAAGAVTQRAVDRATPETTPSFRQLTFRRGTILSARFSPDGDTIVYTASWEGRPPELYSTRVGAVGERALGIQGQLLAISKSGEMALLRDVRVLANWMETGTLARAPLGGGAPREILRDIGGADWSPDGQQLAITRFLPQQRRWRLEYPPGTIWYETDRWIEAPRIARDGSQILLLEHPISGDNRGQVVLVRRDGKKTVLTSEYPSLVGSAWSVAGDEIWFTASEAGIRRELFGVRTSGPVRRIAPAPASVVIEDVRPNGRVLVQTLAYKARILVKTPADVDERDISWFDFPLLRDMSADGTLILFEEEGEGGGPNYSAFVRRTDGSPAIRIGDGYAGRLSPDSQWAITASPLDPSNVFSIVPIGPGDARKVTVPLENVGTVGARWFPDGKRLVLTGNEPGRQRRSYEYLIDGSKLRPLTAEGLVGTLVSADGRTLIAGTAEGKQLLCPLDGGEPREIPGLTASDIPIRWTDDRRSLFVSTVISPQSRRISRVDVTSGQRQTYVTISASDAAGVRAIAPPVLSADGRTYAYRYNQLLSDLFVGDGIK